MISVVNPANGKMVKQLPTDSDATIQDKINKCRSAQQTWILTPIAERKKIVAHFADLLVQHAQDCAEATSEETGRPVHQVKNEIMATKPRIDVFIDKVESVMASRPAYKDDQVEEIITWDPLGVVANISAWNYPYFVGSNVFIPALLTGNGVLYKPSEFAAMTGLKLAELWAQTDLPDGLFATVMGAGDVGQTLLEQDIDGVFFTGSHATGQKINQFVAPKLIKVGFELGGKDPAYVSEDVDVATVAPGVADGAFYNCGQSCCAVERVYVHEAIYDDFVEAFVKAVEGFVVGDPKDDTTYLGPLTRAAQIKAIDEQVADAVKKGAVLRLGGNAMEGDGNFYEPTVLTDVNHNMKVMQEESFGPIIGIHKVSSDQEAVQLMNDTVYGLTASVFCRDTKRSRSLMYHLNAGTVYSNCCDRVSPYTPWSGRGHSGLGSTLSEIGIETFLQPKAWHIK